MHHGSVPCVVHQPEIHRQPTGTVPSAEQNSACCTRHICSVSPNIALKWMTLLPDTLEVPRWHLIRRCQSSLRFCSVSSRQMPGFILPKIRPRPLPSLSTQFSNCYSRHLISPIFSKLLRASSKEL
jgi:hypothetical protein